MILISHSQNYIKCEIYQFAGTDSSNIALTKVIKYDETERVVSEEYIGFKESSAESYLDATYFYFYQDSLLISRTSIDRNNDSTKVIFKYTKNQLLKTATHYEFARWMKKDVDKGIGKPDGDIVTEDDYEDNRTWKTTSIINYKYDNKGNKIEYYAPKLHWGSQNRYTWKYDNQNRVIEHCSYENKEIIWKEIYTYSNNNYEFTRTWYDYKGNPTHLQKKGKGYWPQYKFKYKLDDQNRIIEEIVTNENEEMLSRTTSEYNEWGMIAKTVKYNQNNAPDMTHIYKYKK